LVHTALVLATSQENVTVHAPGISPRVLDNPIVGARESAVADEQDTVVELGAAAGVRIDTRRIKLERFLVSFDGDRDRAGLNGSHEGTVSAVVGDVSVASEDTRKLAAVGGELASAISSGVGVSSFSAETAGSDDVLESLVHQTTFATLVAVALRTVD